MSTLLRWGILGPGRIATRFAEEFPREDHAAITAVASRDLGRARAFAAEHAIPTVHARYDDLLADPEVDLVYIALPHNFHLPWTLAALAAGKHVLCEKPLGLHEGEARAMVDAARKHRRFLMEAVKTRFNPVLETVQKWIRDGRIGTPRLLQADFCFNIGGDPSCRHLNPALAGGAVLDLAVYPLTLADLIFGDAPSSTTSRADLVTGAVDLTTAILLHYPDGAIAQLTVSVGLNRGIEATLHGTAGQIHIPLFNHPREATLMPLEGPLESTRQEETGSFPFEIREVHRCVREGLLESPTMSWEKSLRFAAWQDAILAQSQT